MIALLQQIDEGQGLQRLVARHLHVGGAGERADDDVLGDGQIRERLELLEGARDAEAADAIGPQAGDVAAVEEDAACVERLEAGDQIEQRGLAGAVRPDDADDLALVHIEGDVGVGGEAAVALRHAFDVEEQAHVVLRAAADALFEQAEDAARAPHADEQDQDAVDDEIDRAAGAAEPDAAVFRQRDQDRRAQRRPPQRAAAAEHRHQQDDDGDLGREQPFGIEHQHVLPIERAGDRHHGGRDHEGQHLVARDGDAEACGGIRLIAQRLQAEAEPAATQLPDQEIAGRRRAQRQVIVRHLAGVELQVEPGRGAVDRHVEAGRRAHPVPALEDDLHARADQQRGDREIVAAQAQRRHADGDGGQRREHHADQQTHPWRDAVLGEQHGRGIGADAEEDRVAEADLAGQPRHHVPRLRHQRIEQNQNHQVMRERRLEHEWIGEQQRDCAATHRAPMIHMGGRGQSRSALRGFQHARRDRSTSLRTGRTGRAA